MSEATVALQLLRHHGFGGRKIFGEHGTVVVLHYRRTWNSISDVVLVYGEYDAEGYRADDTVDDYAPLALASHPGLHAEVVGTVTEVVAVVLAWPEPRHHFRP
ncbi:hypothetical protein [Prauserella endophytica]|uniref:Uncharacterized protein n=1 Tax=Prauserella endophytica TaxID=1592324 RepID=A0ABY2RUW3_9PSEU|nr:hypothetical protein [Prauserella endophytica]TKG61532.1 hypothetical protein FCN18_33375 [Prauserella endophytica]